MKLAFCYFLISYNVFVSSFQGLLKNDDVLYLKVNNVSPTQNVHVNQILAIQKLIDDQSYKSDAVSTKCDKVGTVQTNNGSNIVLKNCNYDWWIKKENPQTKRLQTAYLQDIKIHR